MTNTSHSTKKAAAAVNSELVDTFSPVVLNSVKQVADLQNKTLNTAGEQTAEWIGAWKKTLSNLPGAPLDLFFDVASQALHTVLETQKSSVDQMVEQSKAVSQVAAVRVEAYTKIADGMTSIIQNSVERSIEAQRTILEFVGEQNKTVFESTKKQLGATSGPASLMVDTFQSGANAVLEAQKSFLKTASQTFAATVKH